MPGPSGAANTDDDELSDTTRAVRRIRRELEDDSETHKHCSTKQDEKSHCQQKSGSSRRDVISKAIGNGRTTGAVTGISLGDWGSGRKSQNTGVMARGKSGRNKEMGMGLESLANRDSDDEGSKPTPEAPEGSFRRRDVEIAMASSKAKAQVGLDGKVWSFVSCPGNENSESDQELRNSRDKHTKRETKEKSNTSSKVKKTKKKNKKKDQKKEKNNRKRKAKKQKSSSSSSSSS